MPKVPQSDRLPFWMKQIDPNGCIPTNLAAILHSFFGPISIQLRNGSVHALDEQMLMDAYYSTICFENVEKFDLLSKFKISEGSQTFTLSEKCGLRTQKFLEGCSFDEWWTAVTHRIGTQGSYVLISYKLPNGDSHIVTAYEVENEILHVYNPARMPTKETLGKNRLDEMWKQQELNHDILVVSKVSQQEVGELSLVDKDIEIFKLQTAAAHYETTMETGINTFLTFLVGITIFLLGVVLELTRLGYAWYVTLFMAAAIYLVCSLSLYLYPMRKYIREYNSNMQKLDRYAQDVAAGKTAPSLKELCS